VLPEDPYFIDREELVLGQSNISEGLQLGKVYWQSVVWIGGRRFVHAIGMHAPKKGFGYADFAILRGAKYFHTSFGLARDDKHPKDYGAAIGEVYVDKTLKWKGHTERDKEIELRPIEIPDGAKRLRLRVEPDGDNWAAQTTWGNPRYSGTAATGSRR